MKKYLLKAERKLKLHIYPTLAFIAIGVIMAIIGRIHPSFSSRRVILVFIFSWVCWR